ncbi:Pro_dh domain-containing protein [Cephalotus follicularis]|uniref:Proline dehydrogenase n=1 Tax=Cephalotus follicularis TaxID=3775 RepID=A0A1Q3AWG7_CEPFO|nr:Pro_dh domain-containing protein [Cephalotus follicularis]
MATRVLPPKLLRNLRYLTRTLNSSPSSITAVSPLKFSEKPEPAIEKISKPTTHVLNLDDYEKLFSSLSTSKLLHASFNLQLAAIEPIVDFGMWVMKSRLMETDMVRDVISRVIRHTVFEHFCAGEDIVEATRCVRRINEAGLRGMLDFSVEHTRDNHACDQNFEGFLKTVEATKSLPPSSVSSVIVKITAICPVDLLKRVSDLLRWQHKDPSFNLPWKQNTLPLFSDSSPLYQTVNKPEPLTPQEEHELHLGHQRLLTLCQKCIEADVPLTVDAEDTMLQPAIDYLTYASAIRYNKEDNLIVYGTIQAYLKDAKDRLLLATKAAEKMGVQLGFKVVRGAYMSSERKLASSLGYESPIHNSIQETHACYNDCAAFMLEKIASGSGAVILATHNIESGQLAAAKARELGIENVKKLEFAQLYGMSESLSCALRNAGFQVSKYMPFGPLKMVFPYLLRRAEENRGLLSTSTLDRQLMRKELKRRLKAAIL